MQEGMSWTSPHGPVEPCSYQQAGCDDTVAAVTTRTLAVCCEGFPALATGRGADTPLAVMRANRVVSVTPAARFEGVQPGMRRREAQARCPELEIVASDESRDARAFEQVMAVLDAVAPRWEVTEAGRCAVPVRGPSRLFGGDRAVALRVHAEVSAALGRFCGGHPGVGNGGTTAEPVVGQPVVQPVGVAVADGPGAAAVLAEQVASDALRWPAGPVAWPVGLTTATSQDQGASGLEPQGICIVGPGATAAHLERMPTRMLLRGGPSWAPREEVAQLVDVLERLGLVTLGRFARLERTDVLARFGRCGMLAHALARGTESSRVSLEDLTVDVGVSACFDPPAESVDQVGFMAKTLAAELHSGLESRGLGCTRVLVVAETELGERVERLWRDEGTLDAAAVAQRTRWQLEGWLSLGHTVNRQRGGVVRLELLADQVVPANGKQLGLWGGDTGAPERAERGIARLVAMLGPDAVVVPRRHGGRSPRERYRMIPVGSTELGSTELDDPVGSEGVDKPEAVGPGAIGAPWPGSLPKPAPILVWPEPQLVELSDSRGHMVGVNGRGVLSCVPVSIAVGGGPRWDIRSWAGPWCIDERWWDPTGHRRRARLQVLVDSGAHLLSLESGQWRLEATYD